MTEEEKAYIPRDNTEIKNYLDYYLRLDRPGYAVFLSGPWGSGKTWFIQEFKEDFGKEKFIHISLYGVSSLEQVNEQIFQQLYPFLSSKKGKLGFFALKKLAERKGISLDGFDFGEYLKLQSERILIFDDLERCDNPNLVLGFINKCIEHAGNSAIIIGEEDFLKQKDESFSNQKEKTIGRHFTIFPEFETTFNFLVNMPAHGTIRDLLKSNYQIIKSCFEKAKCKNLRTLKFCVTEFYRFYGQLPHKAKNHSEFLSDAINTFFALCVEFRSGSLDVSDIPNIEKEYVESYSRRIHSRNNNEALPRLPLAQMRERHFGNGLGQVQPNLNLLYCFFKYGSVHPEMMTEAIDSCSYFLVETTPSWIKLWHSHSITDDEFEKCYTEVITDYMGFKFTKVGVLRHIAGMLLNYSNEQMIELTYDEIVKLNESIVTEMVTKKMIEAGNTDDFRPFDDVSNGMQFQSLEDENFKKISKLIKDGSQVKQDDQNQMIAVTIPSKLKEDVHTFWSLIAPGRNSDNEVKLYKYPIMKHVNLDEFVSALIEMNPENAARFTVFGAFKDRYEHIHSYPSLKEDLPWLIALKQKMHDKIPELRQPTRKQFSYMLVNLQNIIDRVQKFSETPSLAALED